jgi:hypothetical protein
MARDYLAVYQQLREPRLAEMRKRPRRSGLSLGGRRAVAAVESVPALLPRGA